MSYSINYPTPQGADVQIFRANGATDWIKPQGCSFVWFTLIGAGGNGFGGTTSGGGGGGGSGGVLNCLMPSFLIPDRLRIEVASGGASVGTLVRYQQKSTNGYAVLIASNGGNATSSLGGSAASSSTAQYFSAAGLFQTSSGQAGSNAGNNITAPGSQFVTSGAGGATTTTGAGGTVTTNYGFPTLAGGVGATGGNGGDGISILSNLIVSQGGSGGGGSTTAAGGNGGKGGFGSGGGGGGICTSGTSTGGKGGDGLAVIISW